MKVGIIGNESSKFTKLGEERARDAIRSILLDTEGTLVSGGCHLGGIDIWAEEEADKLFIAKQIFVPEIKQWEDKIVVPRGETIEEFEVKLRGFKSRNLDIAITSDELYVIVVNKLPKDYKGMKFKSCYHCAKAGRDSTNHVKSGSCWTNNQFEQIHNKDGHYIIIDNGE